MEWLNGETGPALCSTSLENFPSIGSPHALEKAMAALSSAFLWLIGALWHSILTKALLGT